MMYELWLNHMTPLRVAWLPFLLLVQLELMQIAHALFE
jgi:hypothetical protein